MPEKKRSDKQIAYDRKVVQPFVDALLSGESTPWINPIASFNGFWPQNAYSKHLFSGGNIFMCLGHMLRHDITCPLYATRKQLKDNGIRFSYENRFKFTILTVPRFGRPIEYEDKVTGEKKTHHPLIGFFYADYFNLAHTEADWECMMPEKKEPPVQDAEHAIQALCSLDNGPKIVWSTAQILASGGGRAAGSYFPFSDQIYMHDRENYKSDGECAGTLAHELTHATGHEKRIGRDLMGSKHNPYDHRYSVEEIVAEASAALLMAEFNINHTVDNSIAYMQHWGQRIKDEPDIIWKAMGDAWAAKNYILSHISVQEESHELQIA